MNAGIHSLRQAGIDLPESTYGAHCSLGALIPPGTRTLIMNHRLEVTLNR